jgi:hypothetical protein
MVMPLFRHFGFALRRDVAVCVLAAGRIGDGVTARIRVTHFVHRRRFLLTEIVGIEFASGSSHRDDCFGLGSSLRQLLPA